MRLSSIITIREVLAEEIERTDKEIKDNEILLKDVETYEEQMKLIDNAKALARYKEKLDKALADIEYADWH